METPARNPWLSTRGLLLLLMLASVALGASIMRDLRGMQQMRTAQAELENVQYGLLDAQAWVDSIRWILEKRIRSFDFGPENRAALLDSFSRMLDTLMREVDAYIREKNQEGSWWQRFQGGLKQGVQDMLVDFDDIRDKAPEYADAIMVELNKPEAREELIRFLSGALSDVSQSTFTKVDRTLIDAIQQRYGCAEVNFCRALLNAKASRLENRASLQVALLVSLVGLMLLLIWRDQRAAVPGDATAWSMGFLLVAVTVLMASGVVTPMLNVEARISELRMSLLGEELAFADQVLYFQSKSVVDIVLVMMQAGDAKSALVGVLVMTFSVVFPLAKLGAATVLLHAGRTVRGGGVLRFFALKSSKWSMADVMVVAIIMAYLGFDGLMESQLGKISQVPTAEVLTTNGTELQLGFFLFFSFCMASLLTSTLLERRLQLTAESDTVNPAG